MTTPESKTCTRCHEGKPLDQFSRNRSKRGGYETRCKICTAATDKEYREVNKEKIAARKKEWYETNREHDLARKKVYREENAEKESARAKSYREANREKVAARQKQYREANRERLLVQKRAYWYRAKYRLTVEEYDAMVERAGGVCEICHEPPPADSPIAGNRVLHVDHDHETGEVRGVLCHNCNKALGLIGDANIAAAVAYIEAGRDLRGMSAEPAPIPLMVDGKRNPVRERDRQLRRKYGIDIARFEELKARQGRCCGICEGEPRGGPKNQLQVLAVDHDHTTGRVRGLLCAACNRSLGLIGDANLTSAVAYLERTSERVAS